MEKGYDVAVVGIDLPEMYCPICLLLMYNPIQFECSHALCEPCFESLKKPLDEDNSEDEMKPLCPTCRSVITMDKVFKDGMMQRMILAVSVKCSNESNGCSWTGELGNMGAHHDICGAASISCTFIGCLERCLRSDICQHQTICEFRDITCIYCDKEYVFKEEAIHYMECEEYPIPCKFGCGNDVSKSQTGIHFGECKLRTVMCPYQFCGCDKQVVWRDSQNHLEEYAQLHLSLTMKTIALQNSRFSEMAKTFVDKIEKLEYTVSLRFDDLENHITKKESHEECVELSEETISHNINISSYLINLNSMVLKYNHWLKTTIEEFDRAAVTNLSLSHFNDFQESVKAKHDDILSHIDSLKKMMDTKEINDNNDKLKNCILSINVNVLNQLGLMESSLKDVHAEYTSSISFEQRFVAFYKNLQKRDWNNYSCVWKIDISKLSENEPNNFYRADNNIITKINCENKEKLIPQPYPQLCIIQTDIDFTCCFEFFRDNVSWMDAKVKLVSQTKPAVQGPLKKRKISYKPKNNQYLYSVTGIFHVLPCIDWEYKKDGNVYISFAIK